MEREQEADTARQEEGEEQLAALIKQAGTAARMRRNKALKAHFNKLKKVIIEAASSQ